MKTKNIPADIINMPVVKEATRAVAESGEFYITLDMVMKKLVEAMDADEVTVEYQGGEEVRKIVRTDWKTRMDAIAQCVNLVAAASSRNDDIVAARVINADNEEETKAIEEAAKYYAMKLLEANGINTDAMTQGTPTGEQRNKMRQ